MAYLPPANSVFTDALHEKGFETFEHANLPRQVRKSLEREEKSRRTPRFALYAGKDVRQAMYRFEISPTLQDAIKKQMMKELSLTMNFDQVRALVSRVDHLLDEHHNSEIAWFDNPSRIEQPGYRKMIAETIEDALNRPIRNFLLENTDKLIPGKVQKPSWSFEKTVWFTGTYELPFRRHGIWVN